MNISTPKLSQLHPMPHAEPSFPGSPCCWVDRIERAKASILNHSLGNWNGIVLHPPKNDLISIMIFLAG